MQILLFITEFLVNGPYRYEGSTHPLPILILRPLKIHPLHARKVIPRTQRIHNLRHKRRCILHLLLRLGLPILRPLIRNQYINLLLPPLTQPIHILLRIVLPRILRHIKAHLIIRYTTKVRNLHAFYGLDTGSTEIGEIWEEFFAVWVESVEGFAEVAAFDEVGGEGEGEFALS